MSNITQRHLQKMDVVYYRKGISGCSDIGTLSVPGLTGDDIEMDDEDKWRLLFCPLLILNGD